MGKNRDIADILNKPVSFAALGLPDAERDSVSYTSSNTSTQAVASFDGDAYRAALHMITIRSGSSYQTSTVKIIHDGSDAYLTESDVIYTGSKLADFSANVTSGTVNLLATPVNSSTTFKISRVLMKI